MLCKREILQRERIFLLSASRSVGKSAGLGTFTAIAASASNERGEKALSRMADAKRAVYEDLGLYRRVLAEGRKIVSAHLSGADHS